MIDKIAEQLRALSRMNDALCDFAMRWKVDGDYMRCRKCNRACCASYAEEDFQHSSDCRASGNVESRPWRAFIDLLGPINTRADSGEAVAWQFRNVTEEGPSPVWHDIDKSKFDVLRNDPHAEVRELFTQPRATELDVRDAYREGFLEACRWRVPVTQDVDSIAFDVAITAYVQAALSQRVEKGNE